MPKRLRLILALVLLTVSLTLLAWGFIPGRRELRRQLLDPVRMQLPTPEAFTPASGRLADLFPLDQILSVTFAVSRVLIL